MIFNNHKKIKKNSQTEKNRKIQEIYKDEMNNECFDCGKSNPDFISANNGVFLCKECMGIHYQFSDEVSLIIKNNLFLLNEEQINYIFYGGNRKLLEFINYEYPQLQNYQPEILYKTQAMQYYRDNLYYCVEGGIKPIKPSGENAYKLISNVTNYPMTEKREKNSNINIEKINNMNNYRNNYNLIKTDINCYGTNLNNDENILEEEDEDINSNLNINNNYYSQYQYNSSNDINDNMNNNEENIGMEMQNSNSDIYNNKEKSEEKSLTEFKNKKLKNREHENITFLSSNNSKTDFYQKKDDFFKEMNRL